MDIPSCRLPPIRAMPSSSPSGCNGVSDVLTSSTRGGVGDRDPDGWRGNGFVARIDQRVGEPSAVGPATGVAQRQSRNGQLGADALHVAHVTDMQASERIAL